KSTQATLERWF
nr:Chain B, Flap structure-specific endonuclease [synthetic construct]